MLLGLKVLLRQIGNIEIEEAYNGQEAINILNQRQVIGASSKKFDFVFLDLFMPVMDGLRAAMIILQNILSKKY